jgi:hypothetical protein
VQTLEKCANCDRTIGKLEQPCVWKDDVVCPECYARLQGPKAGAPHVTASIATPAARTPGPGEIICTNPNCGYVGKPEKKSRGSAIVMIFLLLIAVIPGLLYAVFMSGYDYFCPHCHAKLRSEIR